MFLSYSELLNSLDSGASAKLTINNRRLNKAHFEDSILMPLRGDFRDEYRKEYNQMLLDKATGANGIMQEKYLTLSVAKKNVEEARSYVDMGWAEDDISSVLRLQTPDNAWFAERGISGNYHGGATVAYEQTDILEWVLSHSKEDT